MADPTPEHGADSGGDDAFDPAILIEVAGSYLLGETPSLTRREVAERSGVELDVAVALWRSLGFPEIGDDKVAFTPSDVEAINITRRLTELHVLQPDMIQTFVRAMGQSFARLADWQTRLLLSSLGDDEDALPLELLSEVVPLVEEVQAYIWRRHLVSAASRILLRSSTDATGLPLAVGFVDIVGYTSRSRQMSARDLAVLVDGFEQVVTDLVVDHGGQVIKTIGDEVLYTVDDPAQAALLALELIGRHEEDEAFPLVRVGTAYGQVLSRLGDVYGPVVNIASRLTSVARPGRALVDVELARLLRGDERFRLKRTRNRSVKGYEHLEPWALKHPRDRSDD
ncbi:adenylate/guanylate cyclase catalytic domain protein [Aeromicrobium marinum DSM 15272]|uniref:Adenylate/guanylate cyclase catalytic domain protein n=1 Tax=Aeromicrobium marinum DSM 15272 TaxID=585531 RepID=E2S8L1_9ACTN|nr:adenylate/guanylate cyclase domain-containing protein [Aeromicrobium marinum]EFQ84516.1 adenylate/guanylate cyclase catalytic domain protein [Aeromicrobium marinum DSM 15272]